jgi:steroid delta-isomerase-like uncharacterized protein
MMTRAEVDAFFARRQAAYDRHDAAALSTDYTDDAVIDSPTGGTHTGRDAARRVLDSVFTAFVDMKLTTEDLVIDGERVAQILNIAGTNIGGLFQLPGTGKPFRMPAVFVYELRDGRIVRERRIYDFTGLLVQIGVLKAKPA